MTKQTHQSSELFPSNFSLEKYRAVSSFTIVDWAVNLKRRSYCRFLLGEGQVERGNFHALFPNHKEELAKRALPYSEELISFPVESTEGLEADFWGNSKGNHVRDFTVTDYCIYATDLEREEDDPKNEMEGYVQLYRMHESTHPSQKPSALKIPLWKAYSQVGLVPDERVLVSVNLEGAEEAIISDFVIWLKETRRAFNIQTPNTPGKLPSAQEFQDWSRYMILPYLDLTLWAQAHRVDLTQHAIGLALFPDEYDVNLAERIRKVTKPLAMKASKESYVRALLSLAAASLAESKTG